eukprot:m.1228539 g.1228539  ORF g.1228539 m.1228539 type:complete len:504 (+) comp24646_c0_seq1:285-1796(+)
MSGAAQNYTNFTPSDRIEQLEALPPHNGNEQKYASSNGHVMIHPKSAHLHLGDSTTQHGAAGDSIAGAEALEQLRAAPNMLLDGNNAILHSSGNIPSMNQRNSKFMHQTLQDGAASSGTVELNAGNQENYSVPSSTAPYFSQDMQAPASSLHLYNGNGSFGEGLIMPTSGNHAGIAVANAMHQRAYNGGHPMYSTSGNMLGVHPLHHTPPIPHGHLTTSRHGPPGLYPEQQQRQRQQQHNLQVKATQGPFGPGANGHQFSHQPFSYPSQACGHSTGGAPSHVSTLQSNSLSGVWTVPPPTQLSSFQHLHRSEDDDIGQPPPATNLTPDSDASGSGLAEGGESKFQSSTSGYLTNTSAASAGTNGDLDGNGSGTNVYRSITTGTIKAATTGTVQKCPVCTRTFKRSDRLDLHVRIAHGAERPITCDVCNKAFSRGDSLLVHKRSHSGSLPYRCECGRAFPRKDRLLAHRATHTGEKPFVCTHCNKGFSRKDRLKSHMKLHGDPA